ncbi:MAG: hypothetical protein HY270_11215 [Deltaproteobacteria bacterium]|nr:hypothetical protein [Deltaproteobacteria bacterium]
MLALSAALRRGGDIFGILTAGYRSEREGFTPQQKRIADGIAQLASLALENARLVEELERANGIKSDFVATMSHELRTPLNVIGGYSSLLLDGEFGPLNAEQIETLQRISESSMELRDLINATLDLGRLESGRIALDLEQVNLAAIFEDLKFEVRNLQKASVSCEWQLDADLPVLRTDPTKLKLVLKNIVSNALKFTEKGAVTVRARSQPDGVEVEVTDTGIGIAPESVPKIFEAFTQADSSMTRRYGGVGLGLYIVRQLLELLQGTIAVSSAVGQGATFRIRLPIAVQAPAAN